MARTRKLKRDGVAIPGATGTSYVLTAEDLGTTLTLEVTDGTTVANSLPFGPIAAAASGTPTFPATVDAAIPAPTATLTSGQTTYPATFEYGNLYDLVEGDVLWRVQSDDEAGTAGLVYRYHVVTLADINATPPVAITFTGAAMPTTGTYWFTHYIARGTARSGPSAAILHGPDNIAPLLTAPTTGAVGDTTAVYGFTTNEDNGTAYTVFSLANTAPTALQVEAGQTAAGAAAPYAASLAITSAGAKTATATGLTAPNTYYRFHMHKDAAGNRSAVLAGGSVTTAVAPVTSAWTETGAMYPDYPAVAGAADQVALSNSDRTVTLIADSADVAVKGTQIRSTGKYWVEYSVSAPAGAAAYPGLWDVAATTYINVRGDGASNNGPVWGSVFYADDRTATIRLEVDMTSTPKMIYAFVDGAPAGSNELPSNMTNLSPRGTVGGVTGAQVTINTGQALPMGGATSGYTAWG